MKKFNITDFTGGMVERSTPDDYRAGELGRLYGFVPEDDQSIRSQWPLQSIGAGNAEQSYWGTAGFDESGIPIPIADNNAHLTAVYPIRGGDKVYLIALKDDGTVWWTQAPSGQATATDTYNNHQWYELTGTFATNVGYDVNAPYNDQPPIIIEENPDYRFICELPLDIYKYIKKPTDSTLDVEGTPYADDSARYNVFQFDKDEMPDSVGTEYSGDYVVSNSPPRSTVTGLLLHSRRFYNDGMLTRTNDLNTKKTITTVTSSPTQCFISMPGHGFVTGDTIKVNVTSGSDAFKARYNGTFYVNYADPDIIMYDKAGTDIVATVATGSVYSISRSQTAVICYVDPTEQTYNGGWGVVKAITFPNIRRWPSYVTSGTGVNAITAPMKSKIIKKNKTQDIYEFIDTYPFLNGKIENSWDVITNASVSNTSAFPKDTQVFHPYNYWDKNKLLLPGRGFIPRANTGTMFNGQLILGDIEWRGDASVASLKADVLTPAANTAAGATQYAPFGLRDGNTEPHRGSFYYSEDSIDVFDPRSAIPVSGTDTRIAGMHTINNRLISITTSGGKTDGVIAYTGNFSTIHPYTPGAMPNLTAIRREIILGGVGVADAEDSYNHGNPQTCLWAEFGMVAFIDKTGYVFITDGASCSILDERFPIRGNPSVSTVNDHVASVGKHLFILKDGFLFCYTKVNGKGAWSILKRPEAHWQVKDGDSTDLVKQYNVIKSMRGIGNELYFVVQSYYQDVVVNAETGIWEPAPDTIPQVGKSRVMRFALNGPEEERGCQDGVPLYGLEIQTPLVGVSSQSIKTNFNMVGVNFYTSAGCSINGVQVVTTSQKVTNASTGISTTPVTYTKGIVTNADATLDAMFVPKIITPLHTYTTGYHSYELPAGVGPQHAIGALFSFSGDVKIEGMNIWYTGTTDIIGGL